MCHDYLHKLANPHDDDDKIKANKTAAAFAALFDIETKLNAVGAKMDISFETDVFAGWRQQKNKQSEDAGGCDLINEELAYDSTAQAKIAREMYDTVVIHL